MERTDKILSSQGFGTRTQVARLIRSGAVTINGAICKEPSRKITPETDKICVNGEPVDYRKYIYIMMNKPAGVVSAVSDRNEKTVIDLLPDKFKRRGLFPAGRLDKDTEGLLIITDDGDFAHKMLSPNKKVYKKYFALIDVPPARDMKEKFEKGIVFADGTVCRPAIFEETAEKNGVFVSVCEGKFHQVKKMFLSCGARVEYLKRVSIGNLVLDPDLSPGESRELKNNEKIAILFV